MKRVVVVLLFLAVAATAQFGVWQTPANLGPVVNSAYSDQCTTISKNGLSLFFFSNRYNQGAGPLHLYVAHRQSAGAQWGAPQEIAAFNEGYGASCPALSPDEHRLFFASARPGGCGNADIWVSRRHNRKDDFGWGKAVNLGCAPNGPNTASYENLPTVFEDENGIEVLYMGSGRPGGLGGGDIWESHLRPDDTFGPATLVAGLNSQYWEGAAIRRDGLEAIISTGRPGGPGIPDLWTSKRSSTADRWPDPTHIPGVNTELGENGRMCFSFDGREFYFTSNRAGGSGGNDLYVMKREKLRH